MDFYSVDMVVKSMTDEDHVRDLEEAFYILDEYNMKLNPLKCYFGMNSGKFLGYIVTKTGIEVKPKHIKAIIELKYPPQQKTPKG